jgi:hypothetical protein
VGGSGEARDLRGFDEFTGASGATASSGSSGAGGGWAFGMRFAVAEKAVMYPEAGPVRAAIVLATINARYIHAAVGLRYLYANLGELQSSARILEFDLKQDVERIVAEILGAGPSIVGLGVYIWNAVISCEVVRRLKECAPEVTVVLGGPEVSFEWESQEIVRLAI